MCLFVCFFSISASSWLIPTQNAGDQAGDVSASPCVAPSSRPREINGGARGIFKRYSASSEKKKTCTRARTRARWFVTHGRRKSAPYMFALHSSSPLISLRPVCGRDCRRHPPGLNSSMSHKPRRRQKCVRVAAESAGRACAVAVLFVSLRLFVGGAFSWNVDLLRVSEGGIKQIR